MLRARRALTASLLVLVSTDRMEQRKRTSATSHISVRPSVATPCFTSKPWTSPPSSVCSSASTALWGTTYAPSR